MKARVTEDETEDIFTMEDIFAAGLSGGEGAAEKRRMLGKKLGIGYGNASGFLKKLNRYGITREEFERHLNK